MWDAVDRIGNQPPSDLDIAAQRIAETLVNHMPQGVYLVDQQRRILAWNVAAERLTGYTSAEVVGRRCGDGILEHIDEEGNSLCGERCPLLLSARLGCECRSDVFLHHKQGHRVPVHVQATPIRNEENSVIGMAESFSDNTDSLCLIERARSLERMALIDTLTGIGNRRYCEQILRQSLDNLHRNATPFGLILADIDHFKAVNDTHGHDVGDAVLKMVAGSLASNLRSFDFAGRWGGEEFIVVVHNAVASESEKVAHRLLTMVKKSFLARPGGRLSATISAGVVQARPADTVESLFRRADSLLYESKNAGRNRFTSDRGIRGAGGISQSAA